MKISSNSIPAADTIRGVTVGQPQRQPSVPDARNGHTAVWIGAEMIVWGGFNDVAGDFNTGGKYNPATNSWTATSTDERSRSARFSHGSVDGQRNDRLGRLQPELIVWIPAADTIPARTVGSTTSVTNAPAGRYSHTAVGLAMR